MFLGTDRSQRLSSEEHVRIFWVRRHKMLYSVRFCLTCPLTLSVTTTVSVSAVFAGPIDLLNTTSGSFELLGTRRELLTCCISVMAESTAMLLTDLVFQGFYEFLPDKVCRGRFITSLLSSLKQLPKQRL